MKKLLLFTFALSSALSALADFTEAGYYRIQTYKTERWASLIDNKGSVSYTSTTADLGAIQLRKDFDFVCSDPASIFFIENNSGSYYNIAAQGGSLREIMDHSIQILQDGSANGQKLYLAFATQNGFTKYIGDGNFYSWVDITTPTTQASNDYRKWYIRPLDETGDNFFGVLPDVESNGKFYTTLFGSFPFSPSSAGVKAYYISKLDYTVCVLKEITGIVPSDTPVIIECSTKEPTTNRLKIGGSGASLEGNLLKGVYFCNHDAVHVNRVAYDPKTMRILSTRPDGSLAFVTADIDYIPNNTAYLTVPEAWPAEIRVVTEDAYNSAVDEISDDTHPKDVYDTLGRLVMKNVTAADLSNLPKGLYIIGGKKIAIR